MFTETYDGILRRQADAGRIQIVQSDTLRARVLNLAHFSKLEGHPGQTRMLQTLRRMCYWPKMSADIGATVRECYEGENKMLSLHKRTNPLQLFPATQPLESVGIYLLGPLPNSSTGIFYTWSFRTASVSLLKRSP